MKASKKLDPEPMIVKADQAGPDCKCPLPDRMTAELMKLYEDDPEASDGAPCSIQVFTSRMRDEECLEIATMVDRCLHQHP